MDFKGKIIGLTRDYKSGNSRITIETTEPVLKEAEELSVFDVSCKVKRYRKKRTNDANAYFWVLADKLGKKLGLSKVEVYRQYVKDVPESFYTIVLPDEKAEGFCKDWEAHGLGWITDSFESVEEGNTTILAYFGSSQYDTAQMTALIHMVIHDCEENNISTLTPKELAILIGNWWERHG